MTLEAQNIVQSFTTAWLVLLYPCWQLLLHQAHLRDFHRINTFHEVHAFTPRIIQRKILQIGFLCVFFERTKLVNWCSWWECLSCPVRYLLLPAPGAVPDSGHLTCLECLDCFGVKWALNLNCSLETPSSHKISRSFQFPVFLFAGSSTASFCSSGPGCSWSWMPTMFLSCGLPSNCGDHNWLASCRFTSINSYMGM